MVDKIKKEIVDDVLKNSIHVITAIMLSKEDSEYSKTVIEILELYKHQFTRLYFL